MCSCYWRPGRTYPIRPTGLSEPIRNSRVSHQVRYDSKRRVVSIRYKKNKTNWKSKTQYSPWIYVLCVYVLCNTHVRWNSFRCELHKIKLSWWRNKKKKKERCTIFRESRADCVHCEQCVYVVYIERLPQNITRAQWSLCWRTLPVKCFSNFSACTPLVHVSYHSVHSHWIMDALVMRVDA